MSLNLTEEEKKLVEEIKRDTPNQFEGLIDKALELANNAHKGQRRLSGDSMLNHLINVAWIAAGIKLDTNSVIASILHQALAPKFQSEEQIEKNRTAIEKEFGTEVLELIESVNEIDQATDERQIRDFKIFNRYLLGASKDIRPILIRTCDSLHNARTVEFLPDEKRMEFCTKVLNIYGPMAEYLNIYKIKAELEEIAFENLKPEDYKQITEALERNKVSTELRDKYQKHLEMITDIVGYKPKIYGRIKSKYSIYRKLKKYQDEGKGTKLSDIEDVLAFTILTQTPEHCFEISKAIKTLTEELETEFSDYISHPKPNGYSAIHITTRIPEISEIPVEIQIATHEMNYVNTYGPASHLAYKASMKRYAKASDEYKWVEQIHSAIDEHINKRETERNIPISGDIFKDKIFALTPKGMIIELEKGDTVLDFAYKVHTQIGYMAVAGKIDGKSYKPSHLLSNGDVVEVVIDTSKTVPSRKSLEYANSEHAKRKIQEALKIKQQI